MSRAAVTVENLSKAYRIGLKDEIPDTLVGAATSWMKAPLRNFNRLRQLNTFRARGHDEPDLFWALRDVSFEVAEGEVLGIIGRNGAGKSTLLKILSRITEPTRGRGVIRGRVSSLLEVGTGFHPELSGRENIYMNGTILGMRKREIDRKLDQIIDFSGVEKFLDTPIKRYSSGMKVRLAFSVAAHLEPEILIIDEVLAVGDAEFQKKCLGKMHDVAGHGRTVLFVSHNMAAVESLCTRCILLRDGYALADGEPREVLDEYLTLQAADRNFVAFDDDDKHDPADVTIERAELLSTDGQPLHYMLMGNGFRLRVTARAHAVPQEVQFAYSIANSYGFKVAGGNSADMCAASFSLAAGESRTIECLFPAMNLLPGPYYVNLGVQRFPSRELLDRRESALSFNIEGADVYGTGRIPRERAILFLHGQWQEIGNGGSVDHFRDANATAAHPSTT